MAPLLNGLVTGLFLQLAIGPVFFYILGITISSIYINSLCAVVAVTIVDYLYIGFSIIGLGRLLEKEKIKKVFGIVSALVLLVFAILIIKNGIRSVDSVDVNTQSSWTPIKSFSSSFMLTIASPLTIVFWSSIFSTKAIEKNYKKRQLVLFGIGAGGATFIFLSLTMLVLSIVRKSIPNQIIQWMNIIVGIVLILYSIQRLIKSFIKTST